MSTLYALSIKQPWATLLLCGRKTIEVRKWATARRGRVLIHAGRVADERIEAWRCLPAEWRDRCRPSRRHTGVADLTGCRIYKSSQEFCADRSFHLNEDAWWLEPKLYGFEFENPQFVPFVPSSGWMRFFPVRESLEGILPADSSQTPLLQ